jgi:hypothetical protein
MFSRQNHPQAHVCKTKSSVTYIKMDPEKNEKSSAPASQLSNVSYSPSSEDVQTIRQSGLQY